MTRTDDAIRADRRRVRMAADAAIRVVEILATGTNGGAQEHSASLLAARPAALRRRGRRLSDGQRRAQAQRPGSRSTSSTSPTTRCASRRRRAPRATSARRRPQPHVPRRGRRHTRGDRARRSGPAAAVRRLDGPLEPRPLRRGPRAPARLTPSMDQLIAVSVDRREARRRGPHRRRRSASSTTASTSQRYDTPGAVLHAAARSTAWSRLADRRRRRAAGAGEGPPDAARGVAARPARGPATHTC